KSRLGTAPDDDGRLHVVGAHVDLVDDLLDVLQVHVLSPFSIVSAQRCRQGTPLCLRTLNRLHVGTRGHPHVINHHTTWMILPDLDGADDPGPVPKPVVRSATARLTVLPTLVTGVGQ